MENEMNKPKKELFKPALNYSLLISVALIILSLVFYLVGHSTSAVHGWLGFALFVVGLIYAAIMYRNEYNGGYIKYGSSLGFLTIVGLITGVIVGVYSFILYSIIAPDLMEQIRQDTIETAINMMYQLNPNYSDAELDALIDLQLRFQTPFFKAISGIVGYTFQGFLFGLIISIFVKRNKPIEGPVE